MIAEQKHTRIELPQMLLIAGNGRNVGKTYFACRVINTLAKQTEVTGLKISAHFHPYNKKDVLIYDDNFVILRESQISGKDSSLMLQAGAQTVFFIMAPPEYLPKAFNALKKNLNTAAIVCESGGLHTIIQPGLFFFITTPGAEIKKPEHLNFKPIIINNDGESIDFDIDRIRFNNNKFTLAS
ncbi:hypothetical protein [uncultured Draconibacterium sp.]|uniref:hypothetical protein n=1 Tax=uncultured Draconibacterium sp. TaxID=1573823 RepID=UPI00325FE511